MNRSMHFLVFAYRLLFWLPAGSVAVFWLFYFRAAIHLGHAPRYSIDDPKFIGLDAWHALTWWMLEAAFWSVMIITPLLLLKIFSRKIPLWLTDLVIFGTGFLLLLLTLFSDATTWFFD